MAMAWPLDPLHGDGYQFWSGIGSGSPIFVAVGVFWHRHNCHERRCLRMVRHGKTRCKKHEAT
jgi:hypothetical protein